MPTVDIAAAGPQLSRLVDEAAAGVDIVIVRGGTPVARLVSVQAPRPSTRRVLGSLSGRLRIPDDFDAPLPDDVLDAFEAR